MICMVLKVAFVNLCRWIVVVSVLLMRRLCPEAPVAQRIEHLTTDQKVWGSNPYWRQRKYNGHDPGGLRDEEFNPEHPMAQSSFTSSRSVNFWHAPFSCHGSGFGVMLSSLGSHVAAETNPDPLQRLRFTTNVTYVNGSHPNLQVGDVLIFEIAVSQDQIVISSTVFMDPLCDGKTDCNVFQYTISGNWRLSTVVTEKKFIPKMAHSPHLLCLRAVKKTGISSLTSFGCTKIPIGSMMCSKSKTATAVGMAAVK